MRTLSTCVALVAFALVAVNAAAEIVTYQQGDGKGFVSETDDTTMDQSVPNTTWVDDGQDITHMETDLSPHRHSIVKFPNIFGAGANQIPPGVLIVSATLTLEIDNEGTDCPIVYQLREDWVELEATWNSRSTGVSWSDGGADGTGSHTGVSVGVLPCTTVGTKNLDVTTTLQNWSDGDLNAGWVFVNGTPSNNGVNIRTSEHATTGDRPLLTVEYIPAVFYSVGTNTADLKTGTPDITITAGVATVDVAQTNDIGVGDVIDHDIDNKLVYIWDVVSDTQFRVQSADGSLPMNVSGVTVNSIKRAFNAINDAVADSGDVNHIGNYDLTVADKRLTWVCYDDGDFLEDVLIDGYLTDATRFVTLTVAGASQVATGNSQRHRGIAGTGVLLKPPSDSGIRPRDHYLVVEWLEIDGSDQLAGTPYGIDAVTQGDDGTYQNLLVHEFNQTVNGSCLYFETSRHTIRNNVAYNCGRGIRLKFGDDNVVSNNTIYGIDQVGVYATDASTGNIIENVIAVGTGSDDFLEQSGADFLVFNNNISEDATAGGFGGSGNQTGVAPTNLFASLTAPVNLHLRAGSVAIDAGKDLSAAFVDDIDDETRPVASQWDVGADESIFTATVTYYRSIGTRANLVNQGTITVTVGSDTVTKVGGSGWNSERRGRGDVLIVGPDQYVIADVVSNNELRLTSLPSTGYVGGTYTIARQFTTMTAWENCIDGPTGAGCTYFPVSTSSLVTDDRVEVGIAYRDSPFTEALVFDGSVTDADHTITLTAASRDQHGGSPFAGVRLDSGSSFIDAIVVQDNHVTIDGLVIHNSFYGIDIDGLTTGNNRVVIRHNLIHNHNGPGIRLQNTTGPVLDIYNNFIFENVEDGIWLDNGLAWAAGTAVRILNNSLQENQDFGIVSLAPTNAEVLIRNNAVFLSTDPDISVPGADQDYNLTEDATATGPNGIPLTDPLYVGAFDLHLQGASPAIDQGEDLSAIFSRDIDAERRPTGVGTWDIGADEFLGTTAVVLSAFAASAANGAVELTWETATELNNLGFHLYRATAASGPYVRITERPIPGLGSSPVGARYVYRDDELDNGTTYFYELEDIETTGATERHGPVSAAPSAASSDETQASIARITYGDPSANALRVLKRTRRQVVVELTTEGFYAEPLDDGSVRIHVPGFESLAGELPVERTWVDAMAGRKVSLTSVRARRVDSFAGLRPASAGAPDISVSSAGIVRATQRRRAARAAFGDDASAARIVSVGFQGEHKKALVELAPFKSDASGRLMLARRLVVTISFRGREPSEHPSGRRYRKTRSHERRNVIAHVRTTEPGLYAVRYEDVLRRGRGVGANRLRLSRQGRDVAFHLSSTRFRPGSLLFFVSDGASTNPFGPEAIYELELGEPGTTMDVISAPASGALRQVYRQRDDYEQDRYYQPALVDAPDRWLWDLLLSPETKSYPLTVSGLANDGSPATLQLWLQGASDFDAAPDHHIRVRVNGSYLAETSWDGKHAIELKVDLLPGILRDGDNVLELESVGDTAAAYSMIMLDRYALDYPRFANALDGRIDGVWSDTGSARLEGFIDNVPVLDISDDEPQWLTGVEHVDASLSFAARSGHSYLAMRPLHPTVSRPRSGRLKDTRNRADYIIIGPDALLDVAAPLLKLRQREGLRTKAVSIEDVYSEFGFGEPTPEAVRDFLAYAYHSWKRPSPRYVVLLGDASYDFEDRLGTGVINHVPPRLVKTTYLWTASDPSYGAVNGDDLLPDLAIGRLPASTVSEARDMVAKIVAYQPADGDVALVADNADEAGAFEADADALAASVLTSERVRKIYLSRLGAEATREAIIKSFDDGASLVSYTGHGAIHLWGDENFFNKADVNLLSPQVRQPLVLTMNCLNGFFHFPYFDSLAEALVQAPDKGAIALFSPSGLSLNEPAQLYHRALLEALTGGRHERLGDAVLDAQERYAETGAFPELLAIYHLFGDPALPLR